MKRDNVKARLATIEDLDYVSGDGTIPREVVARKIALKECYIVEMDGQPAGYLRLEYLWSLVPYIALIKIQKAYQKQGCSRILLDFVIESLQKSGYTQLYSSSQADEPVPQAWHRHMGFVECGVINGINDDGVGEIFFRTSF